RRPPRRLREQRVDCFGEIVPSFAADRAERNDLILIEAEHRRDLLDTLRALVRGQLVDLREHHDRWYTDLTEKIQHLSVVVGGVVSHIEQLHDAAKLRTAAQIPLDERLPLSAFLFGDARVPVAG